MEKSGNLCENLKNRNLRGNLLKLKGIAKAVNPTAEGRQLINGKSHHPKVTFKSFLFGDEMRMRRLNQRKEGYLSSILQLKKSDPLKVSFGNDK